jgi:hypothetical protein
MLRSSRTGPTKIGSLTRASAVVVGALVALFGVIAGPLLGVLAAPSASAATAGSGYTAITPYRALGTAAAGAPVVAGTPATVQVTSATAGEVPAGATAAVLNVTASNPTSAGYLEVYPGTTAPTTATSNVNFVAGQTVANLVTVPLSATGAISVLNFAGTTAVDVDVEGFYSAAGAGLYNPISPVRVAGTGAAGTPIAANTAIPVTVAGGTTAIPASASAVVVNLTAAGGTSASYLSAYAAGATPATTSSLNFTAGQTVANRDIVNVGTGGQIEVYNFAGTVNVDVDVNGYYAATGGAFVPLAAPVRITDTRAGTALNGTSIASGGTETFNLATTASTIPATASAVAGNFTVVPGQAPGYITVFPTGVTTAPTASDVNWPASSGPVANFTQANTAGTTAGSTQVYNLNSGSPVDLVIDAFGYFTGITSGVAVVATPATVSTGQTGGVNDSSVLATVTNVGSPVVGDAVAVTATPSTAGSCGTIPTTGTTSAAGTVTLAYVGSAVVGTCTIKVTEANNGLTGTAVITQAANNAVALIPFAPNTTAQPHAVAISTGGGAVTTPVTATVTNPANTAVVGDVVNFTVTANTPGGCGTLNPTSATTIAGGVASTTYTSPFVTGVCTITATEATAATGESAPATSATGLVATNPAPTAPAVTVTALATTPTPASILEGATSTVTVATTPVSPGDTVLITPVSTGANGTFNATIGTTNASGVATFTYTAGTAPGTVAIGAVETLSGIHATAATLTVTAPTLNSVAVTANPASVVDNGTATSTITATVTGPTSAPVAGDVVGFTHTGTCGSIAPAAGSTNSSGVVSVVYTSATTTGFCVITATENGTAQTGSVQVDNIT